MDHLIFLDHNQVLQFYYLRIKTLQHLVLIHILYLNILQLEMLLLLISNLVM